MPSKLTIAINHVRETFPDIYSVAFDKDGKWTYKFEDGFAPVFPHWIDLGILEEAADEVMAVYELPIELSFQRAGE